MKTNKTMTESSPPSEPKSAANSKVANILDGARRVFLADGFDGASMNDIARAASVSKGALYIYFPSKVALFEALIRHDRQLQAEQLFQFDAEDEAPAQTLTRIGLGLMRAMCSADHLAHMRMVIGAVARHASIGKAFFEAGPLAGAERLGAYLERLVAAARLAPLDPLLAADQFLQLCQSGYFKAALFCVAPPDDEVAIEKAVTDAVTAFLKTYAPERA